jgi:hypothetical protein
MGRIVTDAGRFYSKFCTDQAELLDGAAPANPHAAIVKYGALMLT